MVKIAIIDLGSNSARLVIANIMPTGHFMVIDELKEPVRLAQDMEIDGFLRPIRIQQTIKTLRTFRTLYESHGVSKVFAYATAAVRALSPTSKRLYARNMGIPARISSAGKYSSRSP